MIKNVMLFISLICSILFASTAFADPLSDAGLFVADRDAPSVAWRAGVDGIRPTITAVMQGSAAEQAGLKSGDIILSVGGKKIENTAELRAIKRLPLPFVVLRGTERTIIGQGQAAASEKPVELPKVPILRIETGMHTAAIKKVDVDWSGRWLVSASHDKSVRVWDIGELGSARSPMLNIQPALILRPPVGAGSEGKLSAVAISPDGSLVAAGGLFGTPGDASFYLFSRITGRLLGRIGGLSNVILHLNFSPDGRYLAATLGSGGLRLFAIDFAALDRGQPSSASPLKLIAQDTDYGSRANGAHFSPDGKRLVTSCYDGFVREYMPEKKDWGLATGEVSRLIPFAKKMAAGGKEPYSVRFSPDGNRIAVVFSDTTNVNMLSTRDLSLIYAPDTGGLTNGNLLSVVWSRDGGTLCAGGRYVDEGNKFPIRCWSEAGRGGYRDLKNGATNTIMDLADMPDGRIIFGAYDPAIGILAKDGVQQLLIASELADYRNSKDSLQLSRDGSTLQFGYEPFGSSPATYYVTHRTLASIQHSVTDTQHLFPPDTRSLPIHGWKNTSTPTINNHNIKLMKYEISRALAIAPDKSSFLLGTEWFLRRFDSKAREQWNIPAPGAVWGINISGNGKCAVAACSDGTIRWYDYSTGKELVAFFPHADRKRWVLWTPEGFFDASPGAEELIGWHLNRGKDREAEFVSGSAMYKFFYRPDLVQAKFEGKDISAYLKDFDINKVLTQKTLPPKIRFITKPAASDSPDITLKAEVCDNGGGVGDITLYLDNMPVVVDTLGRGLKAVARGGEGCQQFEKTITLQNGSNNISLMAYNKNNTIESTRDSITITHREAVTRKPTLHLLAIAVNSYREGDLRLKYAIPDANALAESVKKVTGGLFEKVQLHTIYNEGATKEAIAEKFSKIGATTRREDVFLLYVAGHGITNRIDGAYYFLPYDFRYTSEDAVTKQGISENDFKKYLANIQATKSLLLLDTCNSGSFAEAVASRGMIEKTAVNKLVRAVGRATIVASSKDQVALEGYEGHGVFTWTLLEGMKGKAASSDGRITVNNLATFVEETLPKITYKKWGYEQIPQKSLMGMDFPIGMR